MSYYGFLPPFGRDSSSPTPANTAGQYAIGENVHIAWAIQNSPQSVSLSIVHRDDPDSTGHLISDSLPWKTNFTWAIEPEALYSNSSAGHDFYFNIQVPGPDLFYSSLPLTITGNIPTTTPTTTSSITPTPTASVPPGSLHQVDQDPPPGPTSAEKGLIATAIVLGAAVVIGAVMAIIYRKSLARRWRKSQPSKSKVRTTVPAIGAPPEMITSARYV